MDWRRERTDWSLRKENTHQKNKGQRHANFMRPSCLGERGRREKRKKKKRKKVWCVIRDSVSSEIRLAGKWGKQMIPGLFPPSFSALWLLPTKKKKLLVNTNTASLRSRGEVRRGEERRGEASRSGGSHNCFLKAFRVRWLVSFKFTQTSSYQKLCGKIKTPKKPTQIGSIRTEVRSLGRCHTY